MSPAESDPDDVQPPVRVPTVTAARWRRELAQSVLDELLPVINSPTGSDVTYADGTRHSVDAPYAVVWAVIGDDDVLIGWGGRPLRRDLERIADLLEDIADPERATGRAEWEAKEAAKIAAYQALPFPCERGAHCDQRFATERGLRAHHAAAQRAARRGGQDWQHRCGMAGTEPCEHKRPDPDAPKSEREWPRPTLRAVGSGGADETGA